MRRRLRLGSSLSAEEHLVIDSDLVSGAPTLFQAHDDEESQETWKDPDFNSGWVLMTFGLPLSI